MDESSKKFFIFYSISLGMYFDLIDELNYGDPWIEGFCPNLLEFIKGYLLIKFEKKKLKKKKNY